MGAMAAQPPQQPSQPAPAQPSPPGRSRGAGVAWFILGLALAVLASTGSAFIVYLMFNRNLPPPRESAPQVAETTRGPAQSAPARAEAAEVPPLGPTLAVDDFVVNLAPGPGAIVHYVRMGVVIEGDRPAVVDELRRREPQVRDTIIGIVRSRRFDQLTTSDGVESVRRELVEALQRLAGSKGRVVNVYFTDFVIQ